MTLIAGIFGRREGWGINPSDCEELKTAISRNLEDKVAIFQDKSVFLAKVDIGAYGQPALEISPTGSVAMLAGEFLLSLDGLDTDRGRDKDLELLHRSWNQDDWEGLAKAQGVFCAAHYAPATSTLTLIADKLGLRPLYYWMDSEQVIFASALRILESLSFVPKTMDLRGVTELVGFGYPLEKRTPYSHVKLMQAAEILGISRTLAKSRRYWRWDKIPSSRQTKEELIENLNRCFQVAIEKRLRRDAAAVSFLSGGLDSRCVVTALREQCARIYTFNFSFSGTQDQVLAAAFARVAGTAHSEIGMPEGEPRWSVMMAQAWSAARNKVSPMPEHPQLVWSGDGGSVGLGHVYLNSRIVNQLCDGRVDAAIDTYLAEQRISVSQKLLRPGVAVELRNVLHTGVHEELAAIQCEDRGRAFYIFLMLNDQRRHLCAHFEDIDLHRIELQVPFYDSDFLSTVIMFPAEACLGHGIYSQWLKKLPPMATSVPWQTYPSHDPCPLPVPDGTAYQWSHSEVFRDHRRAVNQKLIREVWQILTGGGFPSSIIRREILWAATFLSWAGIGDYSHILNAARIYSRFSTFNS